MQSNRVPVFKEIVLAGGGHAHVLLIRQWGMQPIPGVRVILVSPDPNTPYSGMLPGLIAGHYRVDEIHIDLVRLCQWAGVRFIRTEVTGLDTDTRMVHLSDRPSLAFDVLSLDTGSTPNHDIPGVAEHAIPVKPIAGFWQRWQDLLEHLKQSDKAPTVAVVGGGAGSVEIILAMAWACLHDPELATKPRFHLVSQAQQLLPGYPRKVQQQVELACAGLDIRIHTGFTVTNVHNDRLAGESGNFLEADHVFWCTQAAAPDWPRLAGLACDDGGFIKVNDHLQSTSHPAIFAAGDMAHMVNTPRPKAGVYAVRQAPVLYDNLCRWLLGRPLKNYKPQDKFLSLLALGGKTAAGNWGWLSLSGNWVWRWKNRIDKRFMAQFKNLDRRQAMPTAQPAIAMELIPHGERTEILDSDARCSGCGGKVGPQVLDQVLQAIDSNWQPEDASVLPWPAQELVQTIDQISAPFDDPWLLGRIAVLHALNDLYAMNAAPHSIQVALTLPFAGRDVQQRELRQLLEGILDACRQENVRLLGGHTAEGVNTTVCVSANGIPGLVTYRKTGVRAGDVLMLNKPLGTGIVLAGHMQGRTPGKVLIPALDIMNTSNRSGYAALAAIDVHACTDISGFGLLGHLAEMLGDFSFRPQIDMQAIPVLPDVETLLNAGISSSLLPQNAARVLTASWAEQYRGHFLWPLLLDPQTSGGLLASVESGVQPVLEQAGFRRIGSIV